VLKLAEEQMHNLRTNESKQQDLILQFDARHATARRSKHSTAAWINSATGHVIMVINAEHKDNKESASFEKKAFIEGITNMVKKEIIPIKEIVIDDCNPLEKWVAKHVSIFNFIFNDKRN
jgi:hypothetical protein